MESEKALIVHGGRPPRAFCGGKLHKREGTCRNPAGFKTDHVGVGRCHLHGGANPIVSGRYSKIQRPTLLAWLAEHENDPDPMDVLQELQLLRAYLAVFLQERGTGKIEDKEIGHVRGLVTDIATVTHRITQMREAQSISRATLNRFCSELGRAVETHVEDRAVLGRIKEAWLRIPLI